MKQGLLLLSVIVLLTASCKKDEDKQYNNNDTGTITVEFDNIAGSADLALNTGVYSNSSGEQFSVNGLKYYVSNFSFTKTDGTVYTVPQDSSYFLIDESNEESHEPVMALPQGEYKTLTFTLGIDSLHNIHPGSSGVLVPSLHPDMYWNDNRGFVFFNMYGTSPASAAGNREISYRIGGFGGYTTPTFNNLKTITLDLTARGTAKVTGSIQPEVHLMVDVLKFFDGASKISIAAHPDVQFDDYSTAVANNLTGMFRHDHTHND